MEEREIDLKDLFFTILYKWKGILIAGLTGLVILGGYKFYKSETARAAAGTVSVMDDAAGENLRKKQREIRAAEVKITGKETDIAGHQQTARSILLTDLISLVIQNF